MARNFPIGFALAVVLLVGALPQTAWAEHHHGKKWTHSDGQTGSPPPSGHADAAGGPQPPRAANGGGETHPLQGNADARGAGSHDTKQGGNSSAPEHGTVSTPKSRPVDTGNDHALDKNPIDTRIAVQPRLSRTKDHRFHQSKTVFKLWRNKTASLKPRPKASKPDRRNAVGISVAAREHEGGHHQEFAVHHAGAPTPNSDHNLAVVKPAPDHRVAIQPQVNRPIALYRGSLNGSDFTRPRYAGGFIGGAAKPVAALNGSAFALKH